MSARIEPQIVMETENVEIIKAMVRNGIGITIIPYQAVARDVAAGQMFCARIEGRSLVRETGWVYPKMSRTPRAVQEVIKAFERVRPKLKLAPYGPTGFGLDCGMRLFAWPESDHSIFEFRQRP